MGVKRVYFDRPKALNLAPRFPSVLGMTTDRSLISKQEIKSSPGIFPRLLTHIVQIKVTGFCDLGYEGGIIYETLTAVDNPPTDHAGLDHPLRSQGALFGGKQNQCNGSERKPLNV